MKKFINLLGCLLLIVSMCLVSASAAEFSSDNKLTVIKGAETTSICMPNGEEVVINDTSATTFGANDKLEYRHYSTDYSFVDDYKVVAEYNIDVYYTYGTGVNEVDSGITDVQIERTYLAAGWKGTPVRSESFTRTFSFQGVDDLFHSSAREGVKFTIKGYQTGNRMTTEASYDSYYLLSLDVK